MGRVSRSSKARSMREARQIRNGDYKPLVCTECGEHSPEMKLAPDGVMCPDCLEEDVRW